RAGQPDVRERDDGGAALRGRGDRRRRRSASGPGHGRAQGVPEDLRAVPERRPPLHRRRHGRRSRRLSEAAGRGGRHGTVTPEQLRPERRRGLAVRWAPVACLLSFVLAGCGQENPAQTSPTVTVSRTPEGAAIAGATQVVFTATASDPSGGTLTVSWDLGDGQKASGASVVHVYATAGVFPVAVTVSNGGGGVTTVGSSITVG